MKPKILEIRAEIARNGFNLKGFAKYSDVSTSYLNMILNGHYKPSPKLAKKMADALNVSIEDLFEVEIKTKEETR